MFDLGLATLYIHTNGVDEPNTYGIYDSSCYGRDEAYMTSGIDLRYRRREQYDGPPIFLLGRALAQRPRL